MGRDIFQAPRLARSQRIDGCDRVTWTYDNTNQLKTEQRSGANAYHITHTYDPVGNRLVKNDSGARTTWTYDNANQIVNQQDASGTTNFTFDNNGNQAVVNAPAGRTTYTWDYENRLSNAALPSGGRNTFQYDPDGKRTQKEDSQGTSKFIWDDENLLLETDQGDATQVVYTQQPAGYGNLISQNRSGITNFFHFDGLGSASRLTNASQAVTDNYLYEAFGGLRTSSGSTVNPFRFVGRQGYFFDQDLSEYLLRARIYRPDLGRFLSIEPLARSSPALVIPGWWFVHGAPVIDIPVSLYEYAKNDPLLLVDPSGLLAGPVPNLDKIIIPRPAPSPTPQPRPFPVGAATGTVIYIACEIYGAFKTSEIIEQCAWAAGRAAIRCARKACSRAGKNRGYKTPQGPADCAVRYLWQYYPQCTSWWRRLLGVLSCGQLVPLNLNFSCQPNPCRDLCCGDEEEDIKCCHYNCADKLPFFLEVPTNQNCPLSYDDPLKSCRFAQIITTGKCPPNPIRTSPN